MPGHDLPPRLADLLEPAARRAGIDDGARTGQVWSKWSSIVGPEIALHAEPSSLRGGTLRVRADSPAWATELGYLGDEIKRRTNEIVGAALVKEVQVWTGPGRIRSAPAVPPPVQPGPAEGAPRDIDPRAAFQRAFQAWRRGRRGRRSTPIDPVPRGPSEPGEDA
jgi:hypothetical protein